MHDPGGSTSITSRNQERNEGEIMRRVPVTSSNITEIGYDEASSTLEILFRNGRLYQYFDVPPQAHRELMAASSHGQYLNTHIKGQYRYARV